MNTETQSSGAANASLVGDTFPKAMNATQMARAFGLSAVTFRKRHRLGEFKPFELPRAIGQKRWSGERVQKFLNGR
jgi:hypothetical protein